MLRTLKATEDAIEQRSFQTIELLGALNSNWRITTRLLYCVSPSRLC